MPDDDAGAGILVFSSTVSKLLPSIDVSMRKALGYISTVVPLVLGQIVTLLISCSFFSLIIIHWSVISVDWPDPKYSLAVSFTPSTAIAGPFFPPSCSDELVAMPSLAMLVS